MPNAQFVERLMLSLGCLLCFQFTRQTQQLAALFLSIHPSCMYTWRGWEWYKQLGWWTLPLPTDNMRVKPCPSPPAFVCSGGGAPVRSGAVPAMGAVMGAACFGDNSRAQMGPLAHSCVHFVPKRSDSWCRGNGEDAQVAWWGVTLLPPPQVPLEPVKALVQTTRDRSHREVSYPPSVLVGNKHRSQNKLGGFACAALVGQHFIVLCWCQSDDTSSIYRGTMRQEVPLCCKLRCHL